MCIWQCPVYKEPGNGENYRWKKAKDVDTLSKLGTPDNFIQKMSLLTCFVQPRKSTLLLSMAVATEWVTSHCGEIVFVTTSNICGPYRWTTCFSIYDFHNFELTELYGAFQKSHMEFLTGCLVVWCFRMAISETASLRWKKMNTGNMWKSKTCGFVATRATVKHGL